jgi:hypothetical protein
VYSFFFDAKFHGIANGQERIFPSRELVNSVVGLHAIDLLPVGERFSAVRSPLRVRGENGRIVGVFVDPHRDHSAFIRVARGLPLCNCSSLRPKHKKQREEE